MVTNELLLSSVLAIHAMPLTMIDVKLLLSLVMLPKHLQAVSNYIKL